MRRESAADFLIRTVLDEQFRELAVADPHRAFEGYDLSEREREILLARDGRLLGLLGEAIGQDEAPAEPPHSDVGAATSASPTPSLPEVKLLLRLTPFVAQDPQSGTKVSYEASLHPWPDDGDPKSGDARRGQKTEPDGDCPPTEIKWMVRVVPTIVGSQESGLVVSYSASIHPVAEDADDVRPSAEAPTPKPASSPWTHHVESSAARAAARAGRACDA
ncbi:MAG: hypothetical protein ISS72_04830, partial [Candidatus Brocadiae bacterium]|nr:hypothetical protein [Candidatus Brocadiia bacterium]